MKLKFVAVGLLFGATGWGIFVNSAGAAAPSAELAKAKKEAESRGYVFYAKAKEEGRVRVAIISSLLLSNMDPDNWEKMRSARSAFPRRR